MPANPGLLLEDVSHSVLDAGRDKRTLAPLNHAFVAGQFHVVAGPSGAGKTTLLSILALAVRARQGRILWGEHDLTALSPQQQGEWRRQHLGLIFQTSRLVGVMSVREHVRLAALIRGRPEAEGAGLAMLDLLGMAEKLNHLPVQLSGGEKQRVAIAQALCAQPAVLLADEPTAALDHHNSALVAATLSSFARDRGAVVICVTHDRVVMEAADYVLELEKA